MSGRRLDTEVDCESEKQDVKPPEVHLYRSTSTHICGPGDTYRDRSGTQQRGIGMGGGWGRLLSSRALLFERHLPTCLSPICWLLRRLMSLQKASIVCAMEPSCPKTVEIETASKFDASYVPGRRLNVMSLMCNELLCQRCTAVVRLSSRFAPPSPCLTPD